MPVMKTGAVIGVDEDMEEDIEWVPQVEIQLGRGLTKEKMCGKDYLEEGSCMNDTRYGSARVERSIKLAHTCVKDVRRWWCWGDS